MTQQRVFHGKTGENKLFTNNATFDHSKQMDIRFIALEDGLLLGLSS